MKPIIYYIILTLILNILIVNNLQSRDFTKILKSGAVEINELRTETSKTFQNPDGTRTAIIAPYALHQADSSGAWQEIPNSNVVHINPSAYTVNKNVTGPPPNKGQDSTYSYTITTNQIKMGRYSNTTVKRGYIRWVTASIESGSTITNCNFYLGDNNNFNNSTIQYYKLESDPNPNSSPPPNEQIYNDCGAGSLYLTQNSNDRNFPNNSAFNSDLISRLNGTSSWMAIGFTNTVETSSNQLLDISYNGILNVTYTPPTGIFTVTPMHINAPPNGSNSVFFHVETSGSQQLHYYTDVNAAHTIFINSTYDDGFTPRDVYIQVLPNLSGHAWNDYIKVDAYLNNTLVSTKYVTVSHQPASQVTYCDFNVNGSIVEYYTTDWLEICNANINSGTVTIGAGNYVSLKSGFWAKSGSNVTVRQQIFDNLENGNETDNIVSSSSNKNVNLKPGSDNIPELKIPSEFTISQNYPNPFNPSTLIQYGLKENANVKITVYDIMGRVVKSLVNDYQDAGFKSVLWDGTDNSGSSVATGLYIYKIEAGDFIASKKMLMIK